MGSASIDIICIAISVGINLHAMCCHCIMDVFVAVTGMNREVLSACGLEGIVFLSFVSSFHKPPCLMTSVRGFNPCIYIYIFTYMLRIETTQI